MGWLINEGMAQDIVLQVRAILNCVACYARTAWCSPSSSSSQLLQLICAQENDPCCTLDGHGPLLMPSMLNHALNVGLQMDEERFLLSGGSDVLVGSTHDFEDKLRQTTTWYGHGAPRQLDAAVAGRIMWCVTVRACRWIVDMSVPVRRTATTVLLASPNKKHYHEFLKLQGATKLYMDLWTDEEIYKCRCVAAVLCL